MQYNYLESSDYIYLKNSMKLFSYSFIFFIIWWMLFSVILPFGLKFDDKKTLGCPSAPEDAGIARKLLISCLFSIVISYLLVHYFSADNLRYFFRTT